MMADNDIPYFARVLLIVVEVCLIVLADYAFGHYFPFESGRYISMDVLFCLPIIQTAHLTAIRSSRRYDSHIVGISGILLAFVWSSTEAAISWPDFPMFAFALNTVTRSIVFTVIGRVLIKLWREREYSRMDILTGLANRLELRERLETEQRRSARTGRPYSLLFIDLDNFKAINDSLGHQVGDEALIAFSDILKESSRKIDVAARLSGDEFVLLLPDTDETSCDTLIERIENASSAVFADNDWPVSISIGRTTHTGIAQDTDLVIGLADKAMYAAKKLKQQKKTGF